MKISLALLAGRLAMAAILDISAFTSGEIDSDWTSIYYSSDTLLLLGNDGSASTGGIRAFNIDGSNALAETAAVTPGRTKLVASIYFDGHTEGGVAITIAQTDSVIRLYSLPDMELIDTNDAQYTALGYWSALCPWRSPTGNWYFFLFGKEEVVQFYVRTGTSETGVKIYKVRSFEVGGEVDSCAVSAAESKMFFSHDKTVFQFSLNESTVDPVITAVMEADEDVTGLATYSALEGDYLFVAQQVERWVNQGDSLFDASQSVVKVYSLPTFSSQGTLESDGADEYEIQGLSILQSATPGYPAGALGFAIEHELGVGYGLAHLPLQELGIRKNTAYHPNRGGKVEGRNPVSRKCRNRGYLTVTGCRFNSRSTCDCFAGYQGESCEEVYCPSSPTCSDHGTCTGPDTCQCNDGWGGLFCSFQVVTPLHETEANGADGDDPAIWISPSDVSESRIVTTTKSEKGAGLGVFDLEGRLLQNVEAGEPNNVDVVYGFLAGGEVVDLLVAGCRSGDTLCIFEMTANGTLVSIAGGDQPVKEDFSVYGSCTYNSPKTGKQYIFVNDKSSEYLQYELTWDAAASALSTILVRSFMAGIGGQVEGCVTDERNGYLFLGEEPHALWRYDAEPDAGSDPMGLEVATVGDGHLYADVEGVTLVYGKEADQGFILVSCQGVSGFNVYRLGAPHEYVKTFTVGKNQTGGVDGQGIDAVSNTDGITAVGTSLGGVWDGGLVVVHDDANQLGGGGTSEEASFKLVSLAEILGEDEIGEVDTEWNPRKEW